MKKRKGRKRRKFWHFVGMLWKIVKKLYQYLMYAIMGSTLTYVIVPIADELLSIPECRMLLGLVLTWFVFRIFKEDWDMEYSIEETEKMQ